MWTYARTAPALILHQLHSALSTEFARTRVTPICRQFHVPPAQLEVSVGDKQPFKLLPSEIRLLKAEKVLQVTFTDGRVFRFPSELLRVTSPAADSSRAFAQGRTSGACHVQRPTTKFSGTLSPAKGPFRVGRIRTAGHQMMLCRHDAMLASWNKQERYPGGRRHVGIMGVEPVGNYAIRVAFDDLHGSGIFTWDFLLDLGQNKVAYMREYVRSLRRQGLSRDSSTRIPMSKSQ